MDYNTLIGIFSVLFSSPIDLPGDYDKISKNTTPPEVRIYKPINMDESIKFDAWSRAIKSSKTSK